ncbi:adenylyl-sulfate kinase [Litoricola sp.]|nr:adenylyl-sulfate kinase [Litorivicinus sp.]
MIVWIVGLSGAGKTTIGTQIYHKWKENSANTVLVDGDEIRELFKVNKSDESYTVESRRANAQRIVDLCVWLDRQNVNVVCNILCIFEDILHENRDRFSNYFEIFIDVDMNLVLKNDVKGIYQSGLLGTSSNVVGLDIDFPIPTNPDMIYKNSMEIPPSVIAEQMLARIMDRLNEK